MKGSTMLSRKTGLHFAAPLAVILALAGMASAAGPFDGTYRGSETMVRGNNTALCTAHNDLVIVVRNNHFRRRWVEADLNVDVAGDGTFNSSTMYDLGRHRQGTVTITGKIVGASLEADIGSDRCAFHMSLKKS
jgi:hypothetical protein